ncbi:hypothetical protein PR048_005274, partial [Dryococelus australis]
MNHTSARPDDLVGNDGLVEIKCIPKIGDKPVLETPVDQKNAICLELRKNGCLQLKSQINIAKKRFCDFVVYSPSDIFVPLIERATLPLLSRFYLKFILPDIVDARIPRNLSARESAHLLQARGQIYNC